MCLPFNFYKINSTFLYSERCLNSTIRLCTAFTPQKDLLKSSTYYKSTSKSIANKEITLISPKKASLSRRVSLIRSPTHHLLSNVAALLTYDGLVKGAERFDAEMIYDKKFSSNEAEVFYHAFSK